MPQIYTAREEQTLASRLVAGLGYPFRGAALAACVALGLAWYVTLVPLLGLIAVLLLWMAGLRYAIDCMVRTADGYSDPPEVALGNGGSPGGMLFVCFLSLLIVAVMWVFGGVGVSWATLLCIVLIQPAVLMSLAFDGNLLVALNPATWLRTMARFGPAYLVPVVGNILFALLGMTLLRGASVLPWFLAIPVHGFLCMLVMILAFHWMGLIVWHYRERTGMEPEAPTLAGANADVADAQLIESCDAQAQTDPEAAAMRLRDRLREGYAPVHVHTRFRELMRQLGRNDILLQHGQFWIRQLCAHDEMRRALSVINECRDLDANFLPEDPQQAADLTHVAARIGMRRLAGAMTERFLAEWPQHPAASELHAYLSDPSAS